MSHQNNDYAAFSSNLILESTSSRVNTQREDILGGFCTSNGYNEEETSSSHAHGHHKRKSSKHHKKEKKRKHHHETPHLHQNLHETPHLHTSNGTGAAAALDLRSSSGATGDCSRRMNSPREDGGMETTEKNRKLGINEQQQKQYTLHFNADTSLPYTADAVNVSTRTYRDYSHTQLKPNHKHRPMWVCADGYIFLELFLPVSKQASDFLVTIAEPICRPELIHEFQITIFSLYAAISVGLDVDNLLENLNKFSKNELPTELVQIIRKNAQAFGKVKLVLRDNKYWIEAADRNELDFLLQNQLIREARVKEQTSGRNIFSKEIFSGNCKVEDTIFSGSSMISSSFSVGKMPSSAPYSSLDTSLSKAAPQFRGFSRIEQEEEAETSTRRERKEDEGVSSSQNEEFDAVSLGEAFDQSPQQKVHASRFSGGSGAEKGGVLEQSEVVGVRDEDQVNTSGGGGASSSEVGAGAIAATTHGVGSNVDNIQPEGEQFYVTSNLPVLDTTQLAFKVTEADDALPSANANASASSTGIVSSRNTPGTAAPAATQQVFAFEVLQEKIEEVKREALEAMQRPLMMEYDFRKDKTNPNLSCTLKCTTKIRYYQERALRKMFSNGRARSGIIVLPCGAGKTLTGITAACTMRKSVMVLTTSTVAVEQWRKQVEEFTTLSPDFIKALTSDYKSDLWPSSQAGILVSTYTMMAFSGKRSQAADRILQQVRRREWGLLIFDEVQYAPAPAFRKINEVIRSHCKLGLTATLVREDDLIKDLQWLIGPKLFEANWLELQEKAFLAKVTCQEVWCPMTARFYREYIRCSHAKQRKLWVCNPNKLMVCEFLLKYHEMRGDKVIVFSDNVFALLHVAKALQRPFIYGKVSPAERLALLVKFKNEPNFNSIFLSKVGDNAIDIPCANVVIQISFNFASRRQEAQRLGRILRPKPYSEEGEFNAFFYSLVSKDTQEMVYADKRQQFIIDQGYSYKVLHSKGLPLEKENLVYKSPAIQQELLRDILISDDVEVDDDDDDAPFASASSSPMPNAHMVHLKKGLAGISGGASGSLYFENRSNLQNPEPPRSREKKEAMANMHPIFRKFHAGRK